MAAPVDINELYAALDEKRIGGWDPPQSGAFEEDDDAFDSADEELEFEDARSVISASETVTSAVTAVEARQKPGLES